MYAVRPTACSSTCARCLHPGHRARVQRQPPAGQQFLGQGFALGFGGAMTYARARNIRRLASDLPETAIVLETDAPDIAPEWITNQRNEPAELPRIAQCLAQLRARPLDEVIAQTAHNACRVLPRLQPLLLPG
ncbi:MAG: TatD family hydrolase [Burkholderiaceae bacterium]